MLVAGVLGLAIGACGGGGALVSTERATGELPVPSLTGPITARPTGQLPPLSIPARSPSAAPEESATRAPRSSITFPTRAEPEAAIPTQDPPPGTTPAQVPTTGADAANSAVAPSSTSTPSWFWGLLGVVAVLALVGIVLSVRARRAREAWAAQLSAVVAEATWLAHELLPDALGTPDPVARLAIWNAHRPRVESLTAGLNEVAATAPDDLRPGVDQLRAAVSELRSAMDVHTTALPPDDPESLGAVRAAQRWTEQALHTVRREPGGWPGEPVR